MIILYQCGWCGTTYKDNQSTATLECPNCHGFGPPTTQEELNTTQRVTSEKEDPPQDKHWQEKAMGIKEKQSRRRYEAAQAACARIRFISRINNLPLSRRRYILYGEKFRQAKDGQF